ncbi:MAG: LacI family DNA-binding transcriptional regulator [Clostridia bacterium]
MTSMKDVSRHAGVSIATVSNVITGKRVVSNNVKRQVLNSIEALDYQVNLVARGLKMQRTNTLGLVLPDATKLFFQRVISGILDVAFANGYYVNVLNSAYNFHTEQLLIDTLKGSRVDGIILDSCVDMKESARWAAILSGEDKPMPPVISLENMLDPARICSVTVDNAYYSGLITQHLIDCGRRHILYIAGPLYLEHEHAHFDGYRACLHKNGLDVQPELVKSGPYLSESGYIAVGETLDAGLPFDAVQASSDQAAIGATKLLKERGFRIPEDVAVCGFDNLFPSTLVSPAITTVSVPNYEMGAVAVRELIRQIEEKSAQPVITRLDAHMVLRASSCPSAQSAWDLSSW